MRCQIVHHNKKITLLLIMAALLVITSCSGNLAESEFCQKWSNAMEPDKLSKIDSPDELLSAISKTSLGDPGGSLSKWRDSLEYEIRFGTPESGKVYSTRIWNTCDLLD